MGVPPMRTTGILPVSESEQQQQDRGETPLERMGKMPMPRVFTGWLCLDICAASGNNALSLCPHGAELSAPAQFIREVFL